MGAVSNYIWNWSTLLSQALNTLLGGHPEMCLSERVGLAYLASRGTNTVKAKVFAVLRWCINLPFKPFQKDHILSSVYGRSRTRELWNWGQPSETEIKTANEDYLKAAK